LSIDVSGAAIDQENASCELADENRSVVKLENYFVEALPPAPSILEEDCDVLYCCETETVDHDVSNLVEMLTAMGLREPAMAFPGDCIYFNSLKRVLNFKLFAVETQNLLSQRALFEVVSNLVYHGIPITAQYCFGENFSVYTEAVKFFHTV
jgi:hypothetical protein